MTKFTDHLWSDIAAEHGETLQQTKRPSAARRPGLIAAGTLALAVGGTALGLGLTSPGGTSAPAGGTRITTAAYTITRNSNGSVLLQINEQNSLPAANQKLAAMGIDERVTIYMAQGPAPVSGPVSCTPEAGVSGPPLKVLVGTDGTEVIKPGTTGGNSGVGTWHLDHCATTGVTGGTGTGGTGNTGSGSQPAADPAGALVPGRDGSMIMWVNQRSGLAAAARKLAEVGIHGRPDAVMVPGAAPVKGPIDCKPAAGVSAPKLKLKLLLGENGTVSFGPSTNGGTWHAASCTLLPAAK